MTSLLFFLLLFLLFFSSHHGHHYQRNLHQVVHVLFYLSGPGRTECCERLAWAYNVNEKKGLSSRSGSDQARDEEHVHYVKGRLARHCAQASKLVLFRTFSQSRATPLTAVDWVAAHDCASQQKRHPSLLLLGIECSCPLCVCVCARALCTGPGSRGEEKATQLLRHTVHTEHLCIYFVRVCAHVIIPSPPFGPRA